MAWVEGGEAPRQPPGDDVYGELRHALGLLFDKEEEILQPVRHGQLAVVDAVSVGDDTALLRLAEDVGQAHAWKRARGEQVAQHFTGADTGQLINVPDKEQMGTWRNR